MANVVLLDGVTHRGLTVKLSDQLKFQDGLGSIVLFPSELDAAHKEFPIFIRKHTETGQFFLCALLSHRSSENQFYADQKWQSRYVPLMARRGPFLMTKSTQDQPLKMCVDLDDPRVTSQGERLFDDQGKPTAFTETAASILNEIHVGHQATQQLFAALSAHELIESIAINGPAALQPADMLNGLYSVNAKKLKQLSGSALEQLNASRHLQLGYFIASSTSNLAQLLNNAAVKVN